MFSYFLVTKGSFGSLKSYQVYIINALHNMGLKPYLMEMSMSFLRRSLAATMLLALAAPFGFAQTVDYSKPKTHLVPFAPYTAREVPQPNFGNSGRIDQVTKDGKIMLSLNDAIALALENNLDLAIARYNLNIADTDLLRTRAGGTVRGVATGIVQGTPGGGIGGFGTGAQGAGAGGTTSAAGGAGSGTGGLVASTLGAGTAVESFDPTLTANLSLQNTVTPLSNPRFAGVNEQELRSGGANFNYIQGFATGTQLSVGFQNNRQTTNAFTTFLPQLNSSFRATLRQHLLAGFGTGPNLRFIRIAKNNREISDIAFRQQVISTVSQIQNIYWDLVNAYEDVKVRERSVALAQRLLADNKKQVEIGTLAPIEVVRAESEVAARNQELIVAQTNLQLQQLLMKNAITRNISDPLLAAAPVIPTDEMKLADVEPVVPTEDLIREALQQRPELSQAQIDLTNRDINKKAARNALLPTVDLVAWYGASALGGDPNLAQWCGYPGANNATPGETCRTDTQNIPSRTGYGSTFGRLFNSSAPDKGIGLNINIPIRNRAAQADQARSELEFRQAQMRTQQLQNQIRIEVRNAQFSVQQNRARVEAARKGRQLAAETLDAEQKKYALGASTNFNVLQAQRDLAQAESALVTAMSAYEKSRVELERALGRTLTALGIDIAEAEAGRVQRMPAVPGVVPRQDTTPTTQQQNPQQ